MAEDAKDNDDAGDTSGDLLMGSGVEGVDLYSADAIPLVPMINPVKPQTLNPYPL